MIKGVLPFGTDMAFQVQILGTAAEQPGTWLWGWANAASGIPDPLLLAAHIRGARCWS
ncbi:MAG: hypothetical protein HC914_16455 [Chloroflexaceae bacterium]|nr:hypothetical protein [Chloroflexaceae bacterium]